MLKVSSVLRGAKITGVILAPKEKMSSSVEDYRPVAVLATPAKVLESAVYKRLYAQVSAQLTDAQHGFHLSRSTASKLLNYMSDVMTALNRGFTLIW